MKITTNFNEMELQELEAMTIGLGITFVINDGQIVGNEKIPTQPTKAE